jgi:hypothetical protein
VHSGESPVRLDQPGSRGELPVPEGTEPVGRTAHRRPSEDSAVNSSTTRGAKALVSEIDRRRCRTATGVHRWVSGRFLLRSAEIAGATASANETPAGAGVLRCPCLGERSRSSKRRDRSIVDSLLIREGLQWPRVVPRCLVGRQVIQTLMSGSGAQVEADASRAEQLQGSGEPFSFRVAPGDSETTKGRTRTTRRTC